MTCLSSVSSLYVQSGAVWDLASAASSAVLLITQNTFIFPSGPSAPPLPAFIWYAFHTPKRVLRITHTCCRPSWQAISLSRINHSFCHKAFSGDVKYSGEFLSHTVMTSFNLSYLEDPFVPNIINCNRLIMTSFINRC